LVINTLNPFRRIHFVSNTDAWFRNLQQICNERIEVYFYFTKRVSTMYAEVYFHFEKKPNIVLIIQDLTVQSGLNFTVKDITNTDSESVFYWPNAVNYSIKNPVFRDGVGIDIESHQEGFIVTVSTHLVRGHYLMNLTEAVLFQSGGKPMKHPLRGFENIPNLKVLYSTTSINPAYLKRWSQLTWWQKRYQRIWLEPWWA
jgi:hypothetical protein